MARKETFVISSSGCWEWSGFITRKGYGQVSQSKGGSRLAHRRAWIETHGSIPAGLCVCHKCDNRRCVNPDHLFLGTVADNNLDAVNKGHIPRMLNEESVRKIRLRHSSGESIAALGRQFGVSPSTIEKVVKRRTWKYVP